MDVRNGHYQRRCGADADFCYGSFASVWPDHGDFRSTPVNGHSQDRRACLKGANNRSGGYPEVGEPVLSSWDTAVTSCAGANGFFSRMLLGTPSDAPSSAAAPVM